MTEELIHRHCEEHSDEAIHSCFCSWMDCFASLAMTEYNNQEQKTQGETTLCPPRWRRKGHSL
jgi:hypothetical protein